MKQILKLEKKLRKICKEEFGFKPKKIDIILNLKGYRAIGQFRVMGKERSIRLHSYLYKKYKKKYLKEVLVHEYAHYINYMINNKKGKRVFPHGKEWKNIMRILGHENPRATTTKFVL
jgi:predicted SprT family Zn-dependent metalloprotease